MKKRMVQNIALVIGILLFVIGCSTGKNNIAAASGNGLPAPVPIENSSVEIFDKSNSDMPGNWLNNYRGNNTAAFNYIDNTSVEILDKSSSSMPENWLNNSWGNNTASFTYLNEGHVGSHSVKTEVSNYEDGDAKWFFNPVKLSPGDYIFGDYYRSNVDTRVVAAVTDYTGNIDYIDLPNAPASKNWVKYESSFTMPKNGDTVTVYHLLSRNGYLVTDDYSIKPYSFKGFNRGLVTLTFDDGWEENTKTALPIMQKFGYKSNQFYTTTYIENPNVSNPKKRIKLFINAGHEIGSHSVTHQYLTALSDQQVIAELAESKAFLENYLGVSIKYFATPYGSYNTCVNEKIMKYYIAHRTVDVGYNSKDNLDVSRLKVKNILSSTTSTEVAEWVEKAKEEKLWLIVVYHRVTNNPNKYDSTPEMFTKHMQAVKDAGIPVVTLSEALAELEANAKDEP